MLRFFCALHISFHIFIVVPPKSFYSYNICRFFIDRDCYSEAAAFFTIVFFVEFLSQQNGQVNALCVDGQNTWKMI